MKMRMFLNKTDEKIELKDSEIEVFLLESLKSCSHLPSLGESYGEVMISWYSGCRKLKSLVFLSSKIFV